MNDLTLTQKEEQNHELSISSAQSKAIMEVQASIVIAKKFPRDEDEAFNKLIKTCKRPSFANRAAYKFPRGGKEVKGPSINLAREAARVWKNIEFGTEIVYDDEESRKIRAWAWDKESNEKTFAEDSFKKLIYRKNKGWIKPDERDLRELTNRRASILKRNCLLELLPKDMIEEAMDMCDEVIAQSAAENINESRNKIITAFKKLGISKEQIETKLGHSINKCTPEEIVDLRQIWQSISDGNSSWEEYINKEDDKQSNNKGSLSLDDLKPKEEPTIKDINNKQKTSSQQTEKPLTIEELQSRIYSKVYSYYQGDIEQIEKWYKNYTPKGTLEGLSIKKLTEIDKAISQLIKS